MFCGMHGALGVKLAVLVLKALCKLLEMLLTISKERLRNIRAKREAAAVATIEVVTTAKKEKEKKG